MTLEVMSLPSYIYCCTRYAISYIAVWYTWYGICHQYMLPYIYAIIPGMLYGIGYMLLLIGIYICYMPIYSIANDSPADPKNKERLDLMFMC